MSALVVATCPLSALQDAQGLAALRDVIAQYEQGGELGIQVAEDRLRDLGPQALPGILALLSGAVPPSDKAGVFEPMGKEVRALLHAGVRSWSADTIVELLRESSGDEGVAVILTKVEVLGAVDDEQAFTLAVQLASGLSIPIRSHPRTRAKLLDSLSSMLRGSRAAWGGLATRLAKEQNDVQLLLIEAAGASGRGRVVDVLSRFLGDSLPLDLAILDALGRVDRREAAYVEGAPVEVIQRFLDDPDPQLRRAAAMGLGRLARSNDVDLLVPLLDDSDRRVSQMAHWSLRNCSRRDWEAASEEWERWLAREALWLNREHGRLVRTLEEGDTVELLAGLRQIRNHAPFSASLGEQISELLDHEDPRVVESACDVLAQLGNMRHAADLTDVLRDPRPRLQQAAHQALTALCDVDLPADADAWSDWLTE